MTPEQQTVRDIVAWLRDQRWHGVRTAPSHFAREIERKWGEDTDTVTQKAPKGVPKAAVSAWKKGLRGLALGYVCEHPRRVSGIREGAYTGCGGCSRCLAFKERVEAT